VHIFEWDSVRSAKLGIYILLRIFLRWKFFRCGKGTEILVALCRAFLLELLTSKFPIKAFRTKSAMFGLKYLDVNWSRIHQKGLIPRFGTKFTDFNSWPPFALGKLRNVSFEFRISFRRFSSAAKFPLSGLIWNWKLLFAFTIQRVRVPKHVFLTVRYFNRNSFFTVIVFSLLIFVKFNVMYINWFCVRFDKYIFFRLNSRFFSSFLDSKGS
jgi:hypothetical protein